MSAAPAAKPDPREDRKAKSTRDAAEISSAAVTEASRDQESKTEEIARLAYSYWEARGGQGGSPEEDWRRAERELGTR